MAQAGRLDRLAVIWRKATSSDPEYIAPSAQYESVGSGWTPLDGYEDGSPLVPVKVYGQKQDLMASRSEEAANGGVVIGKVRTRWRMRWRDDIDSSMKVTIYGDSPVDYAIVHGPIEIGGRKELIELLLERYTSA